MQTIEIKDGELVNADQVASFRTMLLKDIDIERIGGITSLDDVFGEDGIIARDFERGEKKYGVRATLKDEDAITILYEGTEKDCNKFVKKVRSRELNKLRCPVKITAISAAILCVIKILEFVIKIGITQFSL